MLTLGFILLVRAALFHRLPCSADVQTPLGQLCTGLRQTEGSHLLFVTHMSFIIQDWHYRDFHGAKFCFVQAAQNLVVISREDAGAEQIFRNDGVKLLQKLLESQQEDIVLSALRTLVGLCTGHQSRVRRLMKHTRANFTFLHSSPFMPQITCR